MPYFNHVAASNADIDQAIRDGLLSAGQTEAFALRVHIPGKAAFAFTCGCSGTTYSAIGFMIGDVEYAVQSVLYIVGSDYQRYKFGNPSA